MKLNEVTTVSKFTEAAVKKDITKATNKFTKEHKQSFRSELKLSIEYPTPLTAEVRIDFNTFKSDNPNDIKELQMIELELQELKTGALKVDTDYYCGGLIAPSLIKRGKTLNCDSLMSYVTATFTYASNFK